MTGIHQADPDRDRAAICDLFLEYLTWANARLNEEYGIDFDVPAWVQRDMETLEIFLPPDGRLLLFTEGAQTTGIACMKRIGEDTLEIKCMYVRPAFRRRGIGRALLAALLAEARAMGYATVCLDSARFMAPAHALYRSAGFREIAPYPESEIPPEVRQNWLFMELGLHEGAHGGC
ncbi:MAG: GNAT family N-acetyltransferase [Anaerolineae bacterium]|nr:GNAT family N-acetyltransferase [Anaerolineae bacterium]